LGKERQTYRADNNLKMTVPVRDPRAGSAPKLEVEACANSSVESAGRHAALFTRFIEEDSVSNLSNEPRPHRVQAFNCEIMKASIVLKMTNKEFFLDKCRLIFYKILSN
jgi:hypothetical protein